MGNEPNFPRGKLCPTSMSYELLILLWLAGSSFSPHVNTLKKGLLINISSVLALIRFPSLRHRALHHNIACSMQSDVLLSCITLTLCTRRGTLMSHLTPHTSHLTPHTSHKTTMTAATLPQIYLQPHFECHRDIPQIHSLLSYHSVCVVGLGIIVVFY